MNYTLPAKAYRKIAYSRHVPEAVTRLIDRALHLAHYHGVSCRGRHDHIKGNTVIDPHKWLG
jgi:hypothetical protein